MKGEYEKLIITVTVAPTWLYTEEIAEKVRERWKLTPEQLAEEIYRCYEAGASIVHIHGERPWPKEKWAEIIKLIREKCDIIIQMGLSSLSVEERRPLMSLRPDMMSVIISHHSEAFTDVSIDLLHTWDEFTAQLKLCDEYNVKPELEIWHTGGIWNLVRLLEKKMLKLPPYVTLFFGWPGGTWTPPTFEEVMYRVGHLPPGCVWSTSSMPHPVPNCLNISVLTIMLGGHVRVGTEDYPYIRPGVLAKDNAELVARIVRISKELGREIATPDEARRIIGI
jgi:3-keto-5-aminohexanoate cleavage enzyme